MPKALRMAAAACSLVLLMMSPVVAQEKATDILDLRYADAVTALRGMPLHGNMRDKLDGGAWIVLATLATGFGRADCGLQDGQKWLFEPALEIFSKDEVFELNRLVTANFRDAQYGPDDTQVDTNKLYPISRAAYENLTTVYTKPIKKRNALRYQHRLR